jgi:hypothetical protein
VREHFPCVFLGAEQVKGRAEAVRVYGIPETFVERRRSGRRPRAAGQRLADRLVK